MPSFRTLQFIPAYTSSARTHTHTHTHSCAYTHTLWLAHTHTRAHVCAPALMCSHTHSHTLMHAHTLMSMADVHPVKFNSQMHARVKLHINQSLVSPRPTQAPRRSARAGLRMRALHSEWSRPHPPTPPLCVMVISLWMCWH